MRDAYWYAQAIEILTTAPSWVVAGQRLGLSAGAAKQLAIRLRAAGEAIPYKGKGGRPSVASVLSRCTVVPAGDFRVVSDAEMQANLVAGNLYDPFGDGSPLTVLP